MEWLILGVMIGFGWHWLITWSRQRRVRISWWVWLLLFLTAGTVLSGAQNYYGLMLEYEEQAAARMFPVYGVQVLITGIPAALLLWRQVRRARG